MPPFDVHTTATEAGAWDPAAHLRRVRLGEDRAYYGGIFGWWDPEINPTPALRGTAESGYQFGHHLLGTDGEPGAASIRGCHLEIGRLNGALGGAGVPESDRAGVYGHLAGHLGDAGIEPAELRAEGMPAGAEPEGIERRVMPLSELRVMGGEGEDPGEDPPRIEGHAAIFGAESVPLWGFNEIVHPGAFTKTIQEADVRALQNHDSNRVIGRNRADTLSLAEDDLGLAFVVWPPATTWADDLLVSMRRGDVDQMSFSFDAIRDRFETDDRGILIRHLDEVRLYDISVVTFAAYPQTTAEVRQRASDVYHLEAGPGGHLEGAGEGIGVGARRSLLAARVRLVKRGHRWHK